MKISSKAKLLAFSVCFVLAACVSTVKWVTPKGQPLGGVKCLWEAPSTGVDAPSVCRSREIKETPKDIAQCKSEGGRDGIYSMLSPGTYACKYPAADAGKACKTSADCDIACDADDHQCRAHSSLGKIINADGQVEDWIE